MGASIKPTNKTRFNSAVDSIFIHVSHMTLSLLYNWQSKHSCLSLSWIELSLISLDKFQSIETVSDVINFN